MEDYDQLAEAIRPEKPAPPAAVKQLQQIVGNTKEAYSIRMDARRLLEVADLNPSRFDADYREFLDWRSHYERHNP
jgi:hypothetical protein